MSSRAWPLLRSSGAPRRFPRPGSQRWQFSWRRSYFVNPRNTIYKRIWRFLWSLTIEARNLQMQSSHRFGMDLCDVASTEPAARHPMTPKQNVFYSPAMEFNLADLFENAVDHFGDREYLVCEGQAPHLRRDGGAGEPPRPPPRRPRRRPRRPRRHLRLQLGRVGRDGVGGVQAARACSSTSTTATSRTSFATCSTTPT